MRPAPRKQRCHLGNFKANGSGLYRLTVRHGVPYGTFLTASEESRSLCVFGSGRHRVRIDETRLVRLIVDCGGGLSSVSWS